MHMQLDPFRTETSDSRYLWSTCRLLFGMEMTLLTRHSKVYFKTWPIGYLEVGSGVFSLIRKAWVFRSRYLVQGCYVWQASYCRVSVFHWLSSTTRSLYRSSNYLPNGARAWNYWSSHTKSNSETGIPCMEKITLAMTTERTTRIPLRSILACSPRYARSSLSNASFLSISSTTHTFSVTRLSTAGKPATMTEAWSLHSSILCPAPSSLPDYDVDAILQYVPWTLAIHAHHKIFPLMTHHTFLLYVLPTGPQVSGRVSRSSEHNTSRNSSLYTSSFDELNSSPTSSYQLSGASDSDLWSPSFFKVWHSNAIQFHMNWLCRPGVKSFVFAFLLRI